jgi:hypothetical protein
MASTEVTRLLAAGLLSLACWAAPGSELLSLEDAVRLAIDHNRSIEQAALGAKSADEAIAAARTQRLRISSSPARPECC